MAKARNTIGHPKHYKTGQRSNLELVRACTECAIEYPEDEEYFTVDPGDPMGLSVKCRQCVLIEEKRRDDMERDARIREFDRMSMKAVTNWSAVGGSDIPHINEVYQELMEVYGGPVGYARHLKSEYYAAPPGSPSRQKYLTLIMELGKAVTASGTAAKPLEDMNDEDLEREYIESHRRVFNLTSNEVTNVWSDTSAKGGVDGGGRAPSEPAPGPAQEREHNGR